jgi:antitoxin VapB
MIMSVAKLFLNGRSQAVRLPKEFRMPGKMVNISRDGDKVILEPIEDSWDQWFDTIQSAPKGLISEDREQPELQEREWS